MTNILTRGGDTQIGAFIISGRKKPCLGIVKGNALTIYGSFQSEDAANKFMDELGEFVGAKIDKENV